MPIRLDAYGADGPQFVWRPRREWHLGWMPSEIDALDRGEPDPPGWRPHYRDASLWRDVPYVEVRQCFAIGHTLKPFTWRSGAGHVVAWMTCTDCGMRTERVPKDRLRAWYGTDDYDAFPVANPRMHVAVSCERCDSTDHVDCHHWAPRSMFEDADNWPTAYLCRACHRLWHKVVTPQINQRQAS